MMSPLYSFTTRTFLAYAVLITVMAGLYGAFISRSSQMDDLSARPFSPSLPYMTEVDTTDAADRIKASGIGRVIDPNDPAMSFAAGTMTEIDPENDVPHVSIVVVEHGEPFAYVRSTDGLQKLSVGDSVSAYQLVELNLSEAQFRKSDGDLSTQIFFSAAD